MSVVSAKVLLVDDDESTFILLRELFEERYPHRFELEWAGSFESGLTAIAQKRHDVYLIDHRLGGRSGIDLLKAAKSKGCSAPAIVLTGQDSRDIDVTAMEAGAADFLVKDLYDISRLEHSIRYALDRHRLIDELQHERDLLQALMDNLPDSIYFKDCESRFVRISRSKATRSGLKEPAEAIGKTDFDFFKPEDAQAAFADEQEVMRSGKPLVGKEEMHVWPDGRTSWVTSSKLPFRDKEGHTVGTFGISHDITEQKQALQALRDSEFRTRMIVETALDAFVAIDEHGTIMDWNAQATQIFGWNHREALGKQIAELIIPPQYREAHRAGLNRFLESRQARILGQRLELMALHRDGHEFPVELTISAIAFRQSTLFAAFVHDITKRKGREAALQTAKDAAEAASRAKSDFLANMSHEIRTPMNAIIGMTELVLDTPLAAAQREYLEMVRESSESLLLVINDVLDFSKIESGKFDLISDVFPLREMLGDAMKSLAVRAHRQNLELAFDVAPGIPELLIGDAGRLRQIVVNLVGNSIKFTPQGEVVLEVRRAAEESPPPGVTPTISLQFSVRDTGIGIPEDKLALIFEAFEQADSSTTRKYGGTGLGLAISKRLCELMGGSIGVESQLGSGSTFHFTARFVVAPVSAEVTPVRAVVMRGTRVLIVDDNATNRRILEEMTRTWGLSPTCAENAEQALDLLHEAERIKQPFTVVLSDLHMPETDGFMLAEAMRSEPNLAKTLILMLTSGDRQGDVAKCMELGVSKYLLKPIKPSELFNALVGVLGVNAPEDHAPGDRAHATEVEMRPLRILLAEDSLANQKLAVGLLTKWGHNVTVANNGLEAVRLNSDPPGGKPFDLILMDVQMPELDGFGATAQIREFEQSSSRKTPIVAMTAHALKGDRELCLKAGMDAYIAKPIRQKELLVVLQQIGAIQHPAEPNPTSHPADDNVVDSPKTSAAAALNWTQALAATGGDRELLRDVLAAFLEEAPDLRRRMDEGSAASNWAAVAKAVHTMKASLRLFGGEPLDLAQALEESCKKATADENRDRFAKFVACLENVILEIQANQKGT